MKAFLAAHPETARAIQLINAKPFSSGFANATYNSLDAFRFVNAAGASTPVRLHIRRLENGLERPCSRSRPAPRHLASLVAADAFAG